MLPASFRERFKRAQRVTFAIMCIDLGAFQISKK